MMNIFGSNYETTGTTSADLVLRTKGKIKIQWGNKFIDLINDGKVNCDSSLIYEADEVGNKDGIYVTPNGVILKVGENQIPLSASDGNTFVSFMGPQETTGEQKHQAMLNIGFIYPTLSDVKDLSNGIVYIESEKKLYTITNGVASEYSFSIPNPYDKLFVIAKNDANEGALVIRGEGISNSLAFNNLNIYSEGDESVYDTIGYHVFNVNGNHKLIIKDGKITGRVPIESNTFRSIGATDDKGFRLYYKDGESTLEVDNLIVRNGVADSNLESDVLYPTYYLKSNNVISSFDIEYDDNDEATYLVSLKYPNKYSVGNTLVAYVNKEVEQEFSDGEDTWTETKIERQAIELIVSEIINDLTISITSSEKIEDLSGIIFLKDDLYFSENGFHAGNTIIGDLADKGMGLYSDKAYFKSAEYTVDLNENENSNKLASTKWVLNHLNKKLDNTYKVSGEGNAITDVKVNGTELEFTKGSVTSEVKKLTFTGAINAEYDGKSEVTVNIPQGTSIKTLTFTGASTESFNGSEDVTVNIPSGIEGKITFKIGDEEIVFDGSADKTIPIPEIPSNIVYNNKANTALSGFSLKVNGVTFETASDNYPLSVCFNTGGHDKYIHISPNKASMYTEGIITRDAYYNLSDSNVMQLVGEPNLLYIGRIPTFEYSYNGKSFYRTSADVVNLFYPELVYTDPTGNLKYVDYIGFLLLKIRQLEDRVTALENG